MFVVGRINDAVYEYTLNGSYCIGTASFVDSFSVATQEVNPRGIAFSKSGDKMFIVGATNNNQAKVSEYTLTAPWDVSTASFVDSLGVKSCGADCGAASGLAFSKSGEKMFVMITKTVDQVDEYTLTAPWDVSTASFVDSFSVQAQDGDPTGITFSKSGDKMFVTGANGDDVNEYTLTTAWDVSTASFVDSFSVKSQEANPQDIWFDSSGKTMFITGKSW